MNRLHLFGDFTSSGRNITSNIFKLLTCCLFGGGQPLMTSPLPNDSGDELI